MLKNKFIMENSPTKKMTLLCFLIVLMEFILLDPFYWVRDLIFSVTDSNFVDFAIRSAIRAVFVVILFILLYKQVGTERFKLGKLSWKKLLACGLVFGIAHYVGMLVFQLFPTQNGQAIDNSLYEMIWTGAIYLFLLQVLLISPLYEELIYRQGLMGLFFKDSKWYLDVFLSATLFSLRHIISYSWSWTDFLFYGIMGLAFAMMYRIGKSIWYPMIAHILWNLISVWGLINYLIHR